MKKIFTFALALGFIVLSATSAFALDLVSAKQSGIVGEKSDGLIGAVSKATPEVMQLVAETNAGRLQVYNETAAKQGIALSQVQAIAAQKLQSLATSGQYVMTNGTWVQK